MIIKGKNIQHLYNIYVSQIPYRTKESDLRRFFSKCGQIIALNYPTIWSNGHKRPKGYCLIKFSSESQAIKCVELNGVKLFGKNLSIKFRQKGRLEKKPKNCKIIFISNLNFKVKEQQLGMLFEPCGQIIDIRIPKNKKGYKHGIAYIEFSNTESVDKAIKLDGQSFHERPMEINWAFPDRQTKIRHQLKQSHCLFVSNLPTNFTVSEIQEWFFKQSVDTKKCRIRLQKRHDGSFKGQVYIDFENIDDALIILKQHEKMLGGKKIMITLVLQKQGFKQKFENSSLINKKQSFYDKITDKKRERSLIIHGVPKNLRYETIAEKFNGIPESYKRHKASLVVIFPDRKSMGKTIEKFNSEFSFERKKLKMVPTICESSICIQLFGTPKIMTNSETTKFVSNEFLGVKFSFSDKKKVFVEFDSVKFKMKALEKEWLEFDKKKIQIRKL